jgi:hypothetical protein
MAYYSKTSPGMQARLDPLVEMAQAPIDVSIDQGVERKPTMRQRISRGFRGRRSPAAKAAKALLDDAIEAPLESAAVELGGAGGGALENAVERERIKKKFRSVLKPYSKGILQTLATPYTEIGRQMFRPVRALAFGKEKIYDEKTGEFLRKERRTGIANNRLFRGVRAVAAAPKAAQARAQEVLKSVAAQGGIRGVLSSKETTDKFKQLQGAATKGLRLFTQFGIFTPIILAIAAGIFLIAKNWDKVYKAMAPGIKSIKEAWGKLMEAFKGVGQIFSDTFRTLEGDSKSGEESITSPFDAVGQILNSVLEVISTTVEAIASLINKLAPLFQWLANIMYNAFGFIIHLVKAIAKLLKGDFTEAWGYAKLAIGFFLKYILSITRPILSVFSTIAKIVLKTIGKILTAASKLPGVGKYAAKARDAINSMAEGFNLEKILGEQIDNIFMKEREITATEIAGESIYKPSKRKTENKQIQEPDIPGGDAAADAAADAADRSANKMSNIWDNFLSTLKSKLDETINELKETLNKSFEKVWEQRLKVYDDQIKAIDDLEKKEEELLATQEYIQNRREALNKRSIDQQNYVRNRALAVYEGRIDDARMLDLEFSQTNAANNKAISDLDTSRARDLLKKERDLQRQRIQDAKTAAEELKKIEEENFKKQIDLITQYTPRTDAEWRVMMDTINATIANYGMPAITGSFMDGMAVFQQASDNAKNDLMASAFWSGEWIDTAVLDWISKLSGIPLQNLIKAASDAGAAVGGAFADGVGDTEDEEKPKPGDPNFVGPTVEEAIRYQQRKNFNPQELADAFQGWGPSMPAPQTTVPPLLDRAWSLRPAPGTPPPPPGTPTLGPAIRSRGRSRPAPSYRPRSVFQRAIDTMKDQFEGSGFDSPILKGIVGLIGGGSKGTINLFKSLEDIPKKGLSILGSVFGTIKRGIAGEEVSFKNAAAKNIGKPIIEGIGVGANNETARRKVSTNVKDAVNKANRDVQRDNEIASPSRRFGREVGQPITLGIAAGILNEKVVAVLMQSFETLLRPLLNVERNGKIKINFEVETGGIRSGIEAKLNEILGGQIQFRKPRVFTEIENMFKSIIAGARAFVKQLDISTGTPVGRVGPAQSALESYLSSPIPRLAVGGIVKRRPGGIMANIGEGRYDEAVIPLPRGLKDFSTSFRASTSSMGRFEGSMQTAMSAALREYAGQMPSGDSGQVNIYVDNFIGQPQWFESMMTEYGVKVAPNKQRSYGTMNRKVTSYQDNAFRTGRI